MVLNWICSKRTGNPPKGTELFISSSAIVLLLTSAAKLISSAGTNTILSMPDPIFHLPFRHLFILIGTLELAVACFCLYGRSLNLRVGMIAWLATGFFAFRVGLWWVGGSGACQCLGDFTGALHITTDLADQVMKVILAYMMIGSYWILFCSFRVRKSQLVDSIAQRDPMAER
jgi:hypothetical protein